MADNYNQLVDSNSNDYLTSNGNGFMVRGSGGTQTMSHTLVWDADNEKIYESGTSQGVLYLKNGDEYGEGVVWNGLTSVNETSEGGEPNVIWADDIKYISIPSNEDAGFSIEAYTYPDEFEICDGSRTVRGVTVHQQARRVFGFTFKSKIGNANQGLEYGYKLHIYYNCLASPSERSYSTINDSPEAISFNWDVTTTPVEIGTISGVALKPTAHLTIDSRKVTAASLATLENILYGDGTSVPQLPDPATVITTLVAA